MAPDPPDPVEPLLSRAPDALWRTTLRGVVIHAAEGEEPLLVTTPGDLVWTLLAEPVTQSEIVEALAQHFGADPAAVGSDIEPVLTQLIDVGAVIRVS